MHESLVFVLRQFIHSKSVPDHFINDRLLVWAKEKRKGKRRSDIKQLGLDIFSELDAEAKIESAIDSGYLLVSDITERGRQLEITVDGKLALTSYLTNGYSLSFKTFEEQLLKLLTDAKRPAPDRLSIMSHYQSGKNVEEAANFYRKRTTYQNSAESYHMHLINDVLRKQAPEPDDFIFHLTPKLYVPAELIKKKVILEISGLEEPIKLAVCSPFPNKRYYVGGVMNGRMNTANGFYPIIAKRESFPVHRDILLRWIIDGTIIVEHHLEIDFQFTQPFGNFFSTNQYFSQSLGGLHTFNVVSSLDRNSYLERDAKLIVHDIGSYFEIKESIVLTNFPMELHAYTPGGNYYSKWLQEHFTLIKSAK